MAFDLELPPEARANGWKVKIREDERLESPHVTILRKWSTWRVNLRTGEMMDLGDSWKQVDPVVKAAVFENWNRIRQEWDRRYRHNPVGGCDDD